LKICLICYTKQKREVAYGRYTWKPRLLADWKERSAVYYAKSRHGFTVAMDIERIIAIRIWLDHTYSSKLQLLPDLVLIQKFATFPNYNVQKRLYDWYFCCDSFAVIRARCSKVCYKRTSLIVAVTAMSWAVIVWGSSISDWQECVLIYGTKRISLTVTWDEAGIAEEDHIVVILS